MFDFELGHQKIFHQIEYLLAVSPIVQLAH
jgi:hypothetical protein